MNRTRAFGPYLFGVVVGLALGILLGIQLASQ